MIIGYEVAYRVNNNNVTTEFIAGMNFTIKGVIPRTSISSISVSAYTSVGQGEATLHPDLLTPDYPVLCELMNHSCQICRCFMTDCVMISLIIVFCSCSHEYSSTGTFRKRSEYIME